MTEIVDFEIEHLLDLDLQVMQLDEDPREMIRKHKDKLEIVTQHAWSLAQCGEIVGCAGVVLHGDHWMAWVMLSEKALEDGDGLTNAVRGLIDNARPRDLPMRATAGFPRAERWLKRLGFQHFLGEEWVWVQPAQ